MTEGEDINTFTRKGGDGMACVQAVGFYLSRSRLSIQILAAKKGEKRPEFRRREGRKGARIGKS